MEESKSLYCPKVATETMNLYGGVGLNLCCFVANLIKNYNTNLISVIAKKGFIPNTKFVGFEVANQVPINMTMGCSGF